MGPGLEPCLDPAFLHRNTLSPDGLRLQNKVAELPLVAQNDKKLLAKSR